MKFLILVAVTIFSVGASANTMTCVVKQEIRGQTLSLVRILIKDNVALAQYEDGTEILYDNLKHAWDGHIAGLIIAHTTPSERVPARALALRYESHFGVIRNASAIVDVRKSGGIQNLPADCETPRPRFR